MKRVYIVRHAKSSWKDATLDDFDRPLNKRGKRAAALMGQRLHALNVCPDVILAGTAKRAMKTAKILAKELGYATNRIVFENAIYEAGVSTLLHLLRRLDETAQEAMLIGHNPGITLLAEHLSGTLIENIPTCGVFCLDFPGDLWGELDVEAGTVVFFDYPKKDA